MLTKRFGDLLDLKRLFHIIAYELLHFIQHYQGQRKLAVHGQRGLNGRCHLLAGHVGHLGELFFEQLAGIGLGMGQVRAGLQQRLCEVTRHIHVGQLLSQRAAGRLKLCLDRREDALTAHPQDELGLVVLLGQAFGLEHDTQKRQAHLVPCTRPELACRSMQRAVAFALGAELLQMLGHTGGQLCKAARGGAVGELIVGPERAQHLGQVRLTAAIEAGNPDPRLLGACIKIDQEFVENGLQALFVLAVADEGLQLVAQDGLRGVGVVF